MKHYTKKLLFLLFAGVGFHAFLALSHIKACCYFIIYLVNCYSFDFIFIKVRYLGVQLVIDLRMHYLSDSLCKP